VTSAFKRAVRRAVMKDFRIHGLRHTFASYLAMGGANTRTIQELLGHKGTRMTLRYSHLSHAHLREAVENIQKPSPQEEKKEEGQGANWCHIFVTVGNLTGGSVS